MKRLLLTAIEAALNAGDEILKIYNSDNFDISIKDDKSPLTLADKKSHETIESYLNNSEYPVLSEEGKNIPFEERKQWDTFWMIDPLDGTKEFIKRNGEFTVNIALIDKNTPTLGVIYVPVTQDLYFAAKDTGSFKLTNVAKDTISGNWEGLMSFAFKLPFVENNEMYTVVASRSHLNDKTKEFIEKLKAEKGELDFLSRGSSLKICMVAEGLADIYPRFAPTMEWDTAAGHAIALYAGCKITQVDGVSPVVYNKENLLNPWFIISK